MNELIGKPFDETSTFGDRVHFVHVYVLEAHPLSPDPSPYSGTVWEVEYSLVSQARTYEGRVERAAMTRTLLEGSPLQLVDDLDRDGLINPVWCTYGTAPNATYLIGQDGIIRLAERWTDGVHVEAAIRELLQTAE